MITFWATRGGCTELVNTKKGKRNLTFKLSLSPSFIDEHFSDFVISLFEASPQGQKWNIYIHSLKLAVFRVFVNYSIQYAIFLCFGNPFTVISYYFSSTLFFPVVYF